MERAMRYRCGVRRRVAAAMFATVAMIGCGQPTTPTAPTPGASSPPAPTSSPAPPVPQPPPPASSPLDVTVVTAELRVGVPAQVAYQAPQTEMFEGLETRIVGPEASVTRAETRPAPPSGRVHMTFTMPGTYRVTMTATTRSGSVMEGTVVLNVEP